MYLVLFAKERPSAVRLQHIFDEHDASPIGLLPIQRLQALLEIYMRPDTTRGDWAWLLDTLGTAKDVTSDWGEFPGSEAAVRAVIGLASAHTDDWDGASARISKALNLAMNSTASPDYIPDIVSEAVCEFVRLALQAGHVEHVASTIRYAGPKLHKLVTSHSATQRAPRPAQRVQAALQTALASLDDPLDWVTSQLRPGADGRTSASVYHIAVAILASLVSTSPRRINDAFAYWKSISQKFNSTFIPPHITSLLAYNLARSGYYASAHIVLEAMHESLANLPHTALSREIWIYANQGKIEDTQRIWADLTMRYSPTRLDKIAFATAYAVSGDVTQTRQVIASLFGSTATSEVDTLVVLQRACIAADDAEGAYEYLDMSIAIRPTLQPFQSLLTLLASQANVEGAVALFSRMVALGLEPDAKCYTTLISVFANVAQYTNAKQVFDAMVAAGHRPDAVAYAALINAAVEAGQWQVAADLAEAVPSPLLSNPSLVTTIIKALVLVAAPNEAVMRLFHGLKRPTPQAWALAIQSAADHGNIKFARSLFNDMDSRSQLDSFAPAPTVYVFSILLAAYLRSGDRDSARAVYDEMIKRKVAPSSITYGIITTSFATSPGESSFEQAHNFAMSVYEQLGDGERTGSRGRVSENVLGPLLVSAGRAGDLARAKHYYDIIKESGEVSLSVDTKLMDAYRRAGKLKSVYRLWLRLFNNALRTIPRKTPETSSVTVTRSQNNVLCVPLSITIQALAEAGLHDRLKSLWLRVRGAGFGRDSQNYNHYAVALAKTGDVEGAFHIVDRVLLPRYDEVRDRYFRALRPSPHLLAVEADSVPDSSLDPEDHKDFEFWDPWKQAEAIESSEQKTGAVPHAILSVDDTADPTHRPPNRRHEFNPAVPPEFTEDNHSQSSTAVGLNILRNWRPSDVLWRPSNATLAVLEQAYRQLEDQRAYRAWIGLGVAEEENTDEEPPPVTLHEFGATVKNQDGTDKRLTPKAMVARLNRKYARVVSLIMLHRRKRAARSSRDYGLRR